MQSWRTVFSVYQSCGLPSNQKHSNILKPSFYHADSFCRKHTADGLSLLTQIHAVLTGAMLQFQERQLVLGVRLKCDGTRWRTGGEVKVKLANGLGSQYSSHYLGTCVSSITTADAHTSAASSRLNWRPRRFKWTRPFRRKDEICFLCACHHISNAVYTPLSVMKFWRLPTQGETNHINNFQQSLPSVYFGWWRNPSSKSSNTLAVNPIAGGS